MPGACRAVARMTSSTLEAMRLDVERRILRGERFTDVEDVINASDLSSDQKVRLGLLGWRYVHSRAQQREANAHLSRLTAAACPPAVAAHRHLRVAG
jgi:hypothetical protein